MATGHFDYQKAAARSGPDVVAVAQVLLELCGDGQCFLEQGSLQSVQPAQFQQLMGWSSSALMFQPCLLLAPAGLLDIR